jgi:hypothetical protein
VIRKTSVAAVAIMAVLALTCTSALAFECYNASRSERGNAAVAEHSGAFASLGDILADPEIVGLCPAGVEFVLAGLEALDYRTDVLINVRALMAAGLEGAPKGEELLHDGKGIDHLSEAFFTDADALIGEAFATICV